MKENRKVCNDTEFRNYMKITIKLFAILQSYLAESTKGTCMLDFPDGISVLQVLNHLGIPKEIPKIILINGMQRKAEDTLREGDTLSVFPPIAGG